MVRNEEIYKQALTFRKRGFTYTEIAKICSVHKSTVARWCRTERFSKRVGADNATRAARDNAKRINLLHKARQAERMRNYRDAESAARAEFEHHINDPLFLAGLLLYRACGDLHHTSVVRVTSQDWLVHKEWQRFLGKYLGVSREKMRFHLVLYANHNRVETEKVWAKQLRFPVERFGKTQVIQQHVKRLHNGSGSTIIGNTVLKRKLTVWLTSLEKQR